MTRRLILAAAHGQIGKSDCRWRLSEKPAGLKLWLVVVEPELVDSSRKRVKRTARELCGAGQGAVAFGRARVRTQLLLGKKCTWWFNLISGLG